MSDPPLAGPETYCSEFFDRAQISFRPYGGKLDLGGSEAGDRIGEIVERVSRKRDPRWVETHQQRIDPLDRGWIGTARKKTRSNGFRPKRALSFAADNRIGNCQNRTRWR